MFRGRLGVVAGRAQGLPAGMVPKFRFPVAGMSIDVVHHGRGVRTAGGVLAGRVGPQECGPCIPPLARPIEFFPLVETGVQRVETTDTRHTRRGKRACRAGGQNTKRASRRGHPEHSSMGEGWAQDAPENIAREGPYDRGGPRETPPSRASEGVGTASGRRPVPRAAPGARRRPLLAPRAASGQGRPARGRISPRADRNSRRRSAHIRRSRTARP